MHGFELSFVVNRNKFNHPDIDLLRLFLALVFENTSECKTESIRKMNIAYYQKKINNIYDEKENREARNQVKGKSKM